MAAPTSNPTPLPTVASDYGPLTLCDVDTTSLPRLQFKDAHLLIKLGPKPKDWLLIHRDIVYKLCPALQPGLSEQWNGAGSGPQKIKHPVTGEDILVWVRALKFVDGTFVLEGQDFVSNGEYDAKVFTQSILALPGWPNVSVYRTYVLGVSQMALRILFALLYNADLSPEQCTPRSEAYGYTVSLLDMCVVVCSYAEFLGNLDLIGPRMFAVLKSSPGFWKMVADTPATFLQLAEKLGNEELYQESVRHMVAEAYLYNNWTQVVELGKISEKQVHRFYKPQFEDLNQKLKQLRKSLHRLQLEVVKLPEYNQRFRMAVTRWADAIKFKKVDRWSPLAHTIVGDFVVCELYGEKVTASEDGAEARKAGSINTLITKLQEVSASPGDNAVDSIFGNTTLADYGNRYKLNQWERRQMRSCVERLLTRACKLVNDAFPIETDHYERYGGEPVWCTKKRANFDSHKDEWLTYLMVPNLKQDRTAEPATTPTIVSGTSTADVSTKWLQKLIDEFGDDDDDESTSEESAAEDDSVSDIAGEITTEDDTAEDDAAEDDTAEDDMAEDATTVTFADVQSA